MTSESGTAVDNEIEAFLRGWFGEETSNHQEGLRRSILHASPDYQRRLRGGLKRLIDDRELTTKDFFEATWLQIDDEAEVHRLLVDAYDRVFGAAG
jgi:hypothetical protein